MKKNELYTNKTGDVAIELKRMFLVTSVYMVMSHPCNAGHDSLKLTFRVHMYRFSCIVVFCGSILIPLL